MNEIVFNVLATIAELNETTIKQRDVAQYSGVSLGSVNKAIMLLRHLGYINEDNPISLTEKGGAFLEKYKLKTAIIVAAGFGSRLLPLTLKKPKPLITVNGKPMVETLIESLQLTGVDKIFIVVGYCAEQFNYLIEKYENITLVFNADYLYKNNISSMHAIVDVFEKGNCCVCEADFIVKDPRIFKKYFFSSFYFSRYITGKTSEWCFKIKNSYIKKITKSGADSFTMIGISYWTAEDAKLVSDKIREFHNDKSCDNLFWDEVVDQCLNEIKMKLKVIEHEQIIEIDTIMELIEHDKSYEKYLENEAGKNYGRE